MKLKIGDKYKVIKDYHSTIENETFRVGDIVEYVSDNLPCKGHIFRHIIDKVALPMFYKTEDELDEVKPVETPLSKNLGGESEVTNEMQSNFKVGDKVIFEGNTYYIHCWHPENEKGALGLLAKKEEREPINYAFDCCGNSQTHGHGRYIRKSYLSTMKLISSVSKPMANTNYFNKGDRVMPLRNEDGKYMFLGCGTLENRLTGNLIAYIEILEDWVDGEDYFHGWAAYDKEGVELLNDCCSLDYPEELQLITSANNTMSSLYTLT